jgi:hypothetical protein
MYQQADDTGVHNKDVRQSADTVCQHTGDQL